MGFCGNANAILDGGAGYAQIPYLWDILQSNIRQYKELKKILEKEEESQHLIRILNKGIDNAEGLLRSMPVDEKGEKEIGRVRGLYGDIPRGEEYGLRFSHDKSATEGFELAEKSKKYAKRQEKNADKVFEQARNASPKGAQRMSAQTDAQILHSLNRLIRINSQILTIQGQMLAYQNKAGKDTARHFTKINEDIKNSFKGHTIGALRRMK